MAISERLAALGADFIAAPVLGASPVAEAGTLLWIAAGPNKAIQKIKPYVVGVMGRGMIEMGEAIERAGAMKTSS